MASITLGGNPIHTSGELPTVGTKIADFKLINNDLSVVSLSDFAGKKLVLNIFQKLTASLLLIFGKLIPKKKAVRNNYGHWLIPLKRRKYQPFSLKVASIQNQWRASQKIPAFRFIVGFLPIRSRQRERSGTVTTT